MHELGHNIGLDHSNEGSLPEGEYDDRTGQMGFSSSLDDGYLMCFNGYVYSSLFIFSVLLVYTHLNYSYPYLSHSEPKTGSWVGILLVIKCMKRETVN